EKGREVWLEKRVRGKALEAVLNKIKKDLTRVLDKREQLFLDELAAQGVIGKAKNSD
ncbi:MAG: hypothetical protein GXO35_03460, partial [Gammaproteobacteria bacterium]|nr:hypothetical protein [Gammaproteobacteria bacterium]